ncbi:epoxyqueuosine reductase QueH [bacterium]|nr:epoxyqueuosine reductase QueH [bacterium]
MAQNENKILIHACCGICSGYPIQLLKDMGYTPVVYFSNSNLDTKEEYERRLEAQKIVCMYHWVELIADDYKHNDFLASVKGFENEPERGKRCEKCIEFRLKRAVEKAKELNIDKLTTSLVISPHKNYEMITRIGNSVSDGIEYVAIDFKKKDGFLKTNNLSKELGIYRQNYCGCEFSKSHLN